MTNTTDGVGSIESVAHGSYHLVVGDELRAASNGNARATYDPSTGRPIVDVPQATPADVHDAVHWAQRAQPDWYELGVEGRIEQLGRLRDLVSAHQEELSLLDSIDGGHPLRSMCADVASAIWEMDVWPTVARLAGGKTMPASRGNLHYTLLMPYGVVGRILPFNHPAMFAIVGMLPPLLAGNTVVLKPAEQTPLSALRLGELALEVLPPGVVNVVAGGADTGDAIVAHPAVKRIAFTGSEAIGRTVQRRGAEAGVKHITLELGGKNPMIVFPDADLETVVEGAITGMNFGISGQSCNSNSRVLVHENLHDEFVQRLADRLEQIPLGVAYDEHTEMGPLVSEQQYQRVMGYVDSGRQAGAKLVTGGGPPDDPALAGGYYLQPTAFTNVSPDMRIARDEIFGPVVSVFSWDDYEGMVALANGVDLGLTASVWTNDLHIAHKTAERLQAGYVWINGSSRHFWGMPFGGLKNSGLGREASVEELMSYYEIKSVHTMLGDPRAAMDRLTGSEG